MFIVEVGVERLRKQVADLKRLACRQVIGGLGNEALGDEEDED